MSKLKEEIAKKMKKDTDFILIEPKEIIGPETTIEEFSKKIKGKEICFYDAEEKMKPSKRKEFVFHFINHF